MGVQIVTDLDDAREFSGDKLVERGHMPILRVLKCYRVGVLPYSAVDSCLSAGSGRTSSASTLCSLSQSCASFSVYSSSNFCHSFRQSKLSPTTLRKF